MVALLPLRFTSFLGSDPLIDLGNLLERDAASEPRHDQARWVFGVGPR
ncbi:hypothetical protein ACIREO_23895 [Streptomyces sp. NPDC102441]